MKITILIPKWYARGNDACPGTKVRNTEGNEYYEPRLLNEAHERCCLGFASLAHGPRLPILDVATPNGQLFSKNNWMVENMTGSFSSLADLAMAINDCGKAEMEDGWWEFGTQDLPTRMGNLITIFLEGGDELEFQTRMNESIQLRVTKNHLKKARKATQCQGYNPLTQCLLATAARAAGFVVQECGISHICLNKKCYLIAQEGEELIYNFCRRRDDELRTLLPTTITLTPQ